MWVRFPVAALVSLSKTLNHNCFVLRMGRKAVGPVCCVIHVKEPSSLIVKRRGLPRCFWLAPRNRQLDWWRFTNVDWIGLDPYIFNDIDFRDTWWVQRFSFNSDLNILKHRKIFCYLCSEIQQRETDSKKINSRWMAVYPFHSLALFCRVHFPRGLAAVYLSWPVECGRNQLVRRRWAIHDRDACLWGNCERIDAARDSGDETATDGQAHALYWSMFNNLQYFGPL